MSKLSYLKGIFRRRGKKSCIWICFICSPIQIHKGPTLRFPFKRNWHREKARRVNVLIFLNLNLNHSLHLPLTLNPSPCTAHLAGIFPATILVLCPIYFAFPANYLFSSLSIKKGQKGELPCVGNQHYFLLHLRPAAKHNKHIQSQLGSLPLPPPSQTWSKKEEKQLKRKYSGKWERMLGSECAVFCAEQQRGAAERSLSGCKGLRSPSAKEVPNTGSPTLGRP